MKNPETYQIIDKKPLIAENAPKILKKNLPKHESARVGKENLKSTEYV